MRWRSMKLRSWNQFVEVLEILEEIEETLGMGAGMLHQTQIENVSLSGSSSAKKLK